MPAFATYDNLKAWGADTTAQVSFSQASKREGKTVFLSHSSNDDDLVPGAVRVLEVNGGQVYVDHVDPENSQDSVTDIAEHIRSVIRGCRRFVMLATPRSKDSKWIPWELGLADGIHHEPNIALFPAAQSSVDWEWSEREYLGLYRRIVWGRLEGREDWLWLVWDFRANTAEPLNRWLG